VRRVFSSGRVLLLGGWSGILLAQSNGDPRRGYLRRAEDEEKATRNQDRGAALMWLVPCALFSVNAASV